MKRSGTPWLLVFLPLILAAISLPMALDWIEPNGFYGVRTSATRASEAAWFRANRAAGLAGVVGGLAGFGANMLVLRSGWPLLRRQLAHLAVLVALVGLIVGAGVAAT